jgi:hypothetical protein
VSVLFLNSWRVSSHIVRYDTNPAVIQKQHENSTETQGKLRLNLHSLSVSENTGVSFLFCIAMLEVRILAISNYFTSSGFLSVNNDVR